MIRFDRNARFTGKGAPGYAREETQNVRRVQGQFREYAPTPLKKLEMGALRSVYVKDESHRFGLNAFKGLGAAYAMFRMLCEAFSLDPGRTDVEQLLSGECAARVRELTFATTTDGNHGKGVSWAAGKFGAPSRVFMPAGSVPVRAEAIRRAGSARVEITDMRYDECVEWTRREAEKNGWSLIQDTSWPGYEKVPKWIMQGYTTMLFEALEQMPAFPTHLFLQAGVGSMAAAVAAAAVAEAAAIGAPAPAIAVVEPIEVACFCDSFAVGDGLPHPAKGNGKTLMAGLNCAVPSPMAWEILRDYAVGGFACDDGVTERGMRLLATAGVVSGESGAVTAGLVDALANDEALRPIREALRLEPDSVVLVISTEGDTDPEHYRSVVGAAR